jgi:hypothetical protein
VTVEEIENTCNAGRSPMPSRHEVESPELSLRATFYPMGFPTEVRTNSAEILTQCEQRWGVFAKAFDTEPIQVDVRVVESASMECPPAPTFRVMKPMMVAVADADNYMVFDVERNRTQVTISRAAEEHKQYLQYFFLDGMASVQIGARYAKVIHAGCVALEGRGILLCGDSGAGKSTLSYACARKGWTYVSDDATLLLNDETKRMVTGNCHQVRFRPTAAELFHEIEGLKMTPRAAGKPSVEMRTAKIPQMICAQTARVDFIVFLNRRTRGLPQLLPYRKDVARGYMREGLHLSEQILANHEKAIERLLTAEVFELRYSDLDWAIQRLETLVREGQ